MRTDITTTKDAASKAEPTKASAPEPKAARTSKPRKPRAPEIIIRIAPDTARRIARLSMQLGFDPETIAERCLDMSVREIDWNLSRGVHAFTDSTADEFDVTAAMDSLTPTAIAKLESDGEFAQAVLWEMRCEARGIRDHGDD